MESLEDLLSEATGLKFEIRVSDSSLGKIICPTNEVQKLEFGQIWHTSWIPGSKE